MAEFDTYKTSFPHARVSRSASGVVEVVLHTDGETLVFNGNTHEEFVELFHQIGQDAGNRVVILTGAGEAFIDRIDPHGFDFFGPRGCDKIYREGKKVLANLLDIPVPVIAAVNGPVTVHSEYVLLADIVIATPNTVFQDKAHFTFGLVPHDGIHSLWPEVIGSIRGRTFVLTHQVIDAEQAKTLGVISEIVGRDRLMDRAREIAGRIARLPPLTVSYSRVALTQKLRRLIDESVGYSAASGKPVFDPEERFLGYRGVGTDVTASVRAEQAEEALHKTQMELAHVTRVTTLGELAASITHEVNQPLTAIVMNGEVCLRWLDREVPDLGEVRDSVGGIIRSGRRASEIIQRLRSLSSKAETQKVALDINDAISEVIPLVQQDVRRHQVSLRLEPAPTLPVVLGDRVQLQQVIINLIVNGLEAMALVTDRSRELVVRSLLDHSGDVLVAVEDSGVGIDPENVNKLFNAFFTTKPSGMGMGLSICRSIIENHGGRLWASSNPGPGATFQFTLQPSQEVGS